MTTQNTEHTPTPWEYKHQVASGIDLGFRIRKQGGGYIMASCNNEHATEANAAYIVRAANAYPNAQKLAEALQQFIGQLTTAENMGANVKQYFSAGLIERTREAITEWENQS